MKARLAILSAASFLFAITAWAASSTVWELAGFTDLSKGRFNGLQLTADGSVQLGPARQFESNLDEPALWSLAVAPDNSIYAATGHQGKVFHIVNGKSSVIWSAPQSEVFAICVTRDGTLYAGTSPNGGLYRVKNGSAEEIWKSPGKYIWAIQSSPGGALYVGSGDPGRVYRVEPSGQADVYYDTGQSNVTALLAASGHVYAGTEPNGILYDISAANQATVLYDSDLPEIRALALAPNGDLYAAAMGGAVSTRSGASAATASYSGGVVVATSPTVVTVTEAAGNAQNEQSGVKPQATSTAVSAVSPSAAAVSNSAVTEISGVEKSAIYRITPNRDIQTLRTSKEDNVYDLLVDGDSLIFSTDDHGRVYRLAGLATSLLAEPGPGETTRLLKSGSVLYAALSNPARVVAYGPAGAAPGNYESQVHDANSVAHWGHLQWHGSGWGIVFRTRTGNGARPDNTWSAWSDPIADPSSSLIKSPPARFIQWRAEWAAGSTAHMNVVDVPYLPQNGTPVVHSISISSIVGTNAAKAAANAAPVSTAAYGVTVTDTGTPTSASSTTSSTQNVSRLQTTQTQISWQADDPDSDRLVYSVYFKAEDETGWQVIRARTFENSITLDPDVLADGRYIFRVVASDAPSNAAEYAREAELISTPVLVDSTPPAVTLGSPIRTGSTLDIDVDSHDQTSSLRLCEYSLDAGMWQPVEAVDGITDSPTERFHLHLDKLAPGEHLLVFRVYDAANNAGLARVVLR